MDAVRFLEERKRMFKNGKPIPNLDVDINYDSEKAVKFVEAWSAAHPRKTHQDVFLEQYPEAEIDANGILDMCPAPIFRSHRRAGGGCLELKKECAECRREFWSEVIE